MADDAQELLGKWTVRVKDWVWEYEFSSGGKVTWNDTRSSEKGVGRWVLGLTAINISWTDAPTTETWSRPVTPAKQRGQYKATYFVGDYEAQKINAVPAGVDPEIGKLSMDRYVDMFKEIKYDLNYKTPPTKSFGFSSILQATYDDGEVVEFDIDTDFSLAPPQLGETRDIMAKAKLGRGNRIMPSVLNSATTPRLWTARVEALNKQDEDARVFMGVAIAGTALILSIPAMPAGMAPPPGAPRTVTRRPVQGTTVPPAPIIQNSVRFGPGNAAGSLWARIQQTSAGVVYIVEMIFLQGKGAGVATARATHREMIRRAALAAKTSGQPTFKMVGKQAGPNFVRHADQLAKEVGVAGSGKASGGISGAMNPDYTVVLDVAKTLAQ